MRKMLVVMGVVFFMTVSLCWASNDYPSKPIEINVAYPAGGTVDLCTRILAEKMQEYLGQPMVVICRPGGAGALAASEIVNAKPDGYLLLAITIGVTTRTLFNPSYPYRHTQLKPIGILGPITQGIWVDPDLPIKNLKDN